MQSDSVEKGSPDGLGTVEDASQGAPTADGGMTADAGMTANDDTSGVSKEARTNDRELKDGAGTDPKISTGEGNGEPGPDGGTNDRPTQFFPREIAVFIAIGIAFIIVGVAVHMSIQSSLESRLELDSDFDEEFTTNGRSTFVNTDHMFPYDPTYNGTGTSAAQGPFDTQKVTRIKGVETRGSYVEYSYVTEIPDQPTLLIDVNTGAAPGGVAMSPPGGGPPGPQPFQPHRPTNTTLYLDMEDWDYRTDIYEEKNLTLKRGYVRSLITHDLGKKPYSVWIGPLEDTTQASFLRTEDVRDIGSYVFSYNYTMEIPYPIYANESTGLTVFMEWQETTVEYHEPQTGALLKLTSNLTYRLKIMGQGPPRTVTIYTEESEYEISAGDAEDFSSGLFFIKFSSAIMASLGILGIMIMVAGIVWKLDVFRPDDRKNPKRK